MPSSVALSGPLAGNVLNLLNDKVLANF